MSRPPDLRPPAARDVYVPCRFDSGTSFLVLTRDRCGDDTGRDMEVCWNGAWWRRYQTPVLASQAFKDDDPRSRSPVIGRRRPR